MAKKTAASKGYRKVKKAKPFLTKNEIIALVVIVIVIAIGAVIINQLPKKGTIPASKVAEGDIIAIANTDVDHRYKKVGTIGSLEGYTLETTTSVENPTGGYRFIPEDEDSDIEYVRVGGAIWSADKMMGSVMPSIQTIGTSDYSAEPVETTIAGNRAFVCTARSSKYDETKAPAAAAEGAETAEQPHNSFSQFIYPYTDSIDGYSISLTCTLEGDDASVYVADEDLTAFLEQFEGAFIPAEEKK